jgi:hypothetical protein
MLLTHLDAPVSLAVHYHFSHMGWLNDILLSTNMQKITNIGVVPYGMPPDLGERTTNGVLIFRTIHYDFSVSHDSILVIVSA